jgi:hypothetical protein
MLDIVPCEGARGWGCVVMLTIGCLPDTPLLELESSGGTSAEIACEGAACDCPIAYPDDDGDGHGDPVRGFHLCTELRPGMVLVGDDCYDGNADAYPGAVRYFAVDRGDGSYDYDCDGDELVLHAREARCQKWPICEPLPIDGRGWVGRIPDCGEAGNWMHDCDFRIGWSHCRQEVDRGFRAQCR